MKRFKMTPVLNGLLMVLITAIVSCSDPGSEPAPTPPPPPPGGSGDVIISGITAGPLFWGDEMIITGTGFSATKENNIVKLLVPPPNFCSLNYTSAGGDIEIISATATEIKMKVPVKILSNIPYCGPEKCSIEVTVGDKKATYENIRFHGLPYVDNFLYHYGWFDIPSVTRIGDSVMIAGGMRGAYARESELWSEIRLTINGSNVPIKFRTIGLESGWSFYMPAKDFGEINCSTEPDDWSAREMDFEFSIAGTNKKSGVKKLFVQYLPQQSANCSECAGSISKSAPENLTWKVTGKNIYYNKVRFSSTNCGGPSQEVDLSPAPHFGDQTSFSIPLSILAENCSYSVSLVDACGGSKQLGTVSITP